MKDEDLKARVTVRGPQQPFSKNFRLGGMGLGEVELELVSAHDSHSREAPPEEQWTQQIPMCTVAYAVYL